MCKLGSMAYSAGVKVRLYHILSGFKCWFYCTEWRWNMSCVWCRPALCRILLLANYFARNYGKFMSAHCDGPDVMGECELADMPGRAVTSRASLGCATGQCKRRSSFVCVVESKYELDVPWGCWHACASCAETARFVLLFLLALGQRDCRRVMCF